MATLKVDTITSDTLPTVSITDGLSISGVSTSIGRLYVNDRITCTEHIDIDADNKAVRIGDAQNLQLTYTGSAAEITNIDASTPINIKVRDGAETAAVFNPNSSVDLYHNNVRTFATDGNGFFSLGPEGGNANIYLYADEGDDDADKWSLEALASGSTFTINNRLSGGFQKNIECNGGGNVELYHNNTLMVETTTTGIKVPIATSGHGITIDAASNNVYPQLTFNANRSAENNSIGYIRGQWNSTDVVAIDFMAGPDTTNKDDGAIKCSTRESGSGITEAMRITSKGEIKINQTGDGGWGSTAKGVVFIRGNDMSNGLLRICDTNGANDQTFVRFQYNDHSNNCGGIQRNGTTTSPQFFSGSDRRIKTNIADMPNVLDKINQVKIKTWELKSDSESKGISPIAQDLVSIFPNKVSKTDDGTGDTVPDGVEPWSIGLDYTWELVKSVQELSAKIETLETKVAALESA